MTVYNEGPSTKTMIICTVVCVLLIAGAVHSSITAQQHETQRQEEQGCAYYKKHTITNVPVACYDFFKKENHWKD